MTPVLVRELISALDIDYSKPVIVNIECSEKMLVTFHSSIKAEIEAAGLIIKDEDSTRNVVEHLFPKVYYPLGNKNIGTFTINHNPSNKVFSIKIIDNETIS